MMDDEILFDIDTPLDLKVRCARQYWELITTLKHPVMADHLDDVQETLRAPDEIRESKQDEYVLLFYRKVAEDQQRWWCVVTRRLNGDGSVITVYPTDAIKRGEQRWKK